jgi:recombination protein RecA
MYNEGISISGDILDAGVAYGIVNKSGNSYYYNEERLGVGRENAKKYLKDTPKTKEKIKKDIIKEVKAKEEEEN